MSVAAAVSGSADQPMPPSWHPTAPSKVCVIVPTLNEERYIEACLSSLLRQVDCHITELIVADGGSTDSTPRLVKTLALQHPAIKLLRNPGRIQSAGVNLAVATADAAATIILRADAHVAYAPDFIARCVGAMQASGATSVVVPMRTVGKTGFQRAVAFVQNSRLGNGGAAHRVAGGGSGFVDHGHHAAFDRRFFTACGGYDESFTHNEDAELDYRAHLAGGRVWMCAEACVDYFPRTTPGALARQYFRNGRGRARTLTKHGLRPRLRQLAPVIMLFAVVGSLGLALVWWPFCLIAVLYAALCSYAGVAAAIQQRDLSLLAAGPAAVIMHLSYGAGFVQTTMRHLWSVRRVPVAASGSGAG